MRISASLWPIQCAILVLNTGDDNETLGCSGPPEGSRGIHQCLVVFCSHLCVLLYFTAIYVSCCILQSSMCLVVFHSNLCVLLYFAVICVSCCILQQSVCLAVFCSHLCVLLCFTAICVSCCILQSSMCLSVLCSHQCVLVNCVVISVSWLILQTSVTAIARKRSQSLCPKCRWQVTAKHAYTLRMWFLHGVTGCMVVWCTQNAPRLQQFYVAPAMPAL